MLCCAIPASPRLSLKMLRPTQERAGGGVLIRTIDYLQQFFVVRFA
jgi:hypothetical protein